VIIDQVDVDVQKLNITTYPCVCWCCCVAVPVYYRSSWQEQKNWEI